MAEHVGADPGPPFVQLGPDPSNPLHTQPIRFVGSFPDAQVRVEPELPEIAFIGRSNVGKSSLLNALVGRPGLARVSGSPGKTTLLNFYRAPELYLVDLPGYGYAKASHSARAGYRKLVDGYLQRRSTLAGVVWLLDIRRDPSKEDREMQDLLVRSGRPVLAVFTKADKLTRSAVEPRARELARALGLGPDEFQLTSSRTTSGLAELASSIVAVGKENS
ncbi:MAG: ribosome biogenesis GTP-binding protein YihA/YsxC [Gemmatimonadales bacterium]